MRLFIQNGGRHYLLAGNRWRCQRPAKTGHQLPPGAAIVASIQWTVVQRELVGFWVWGSSKLEVSPAVFD